MIKKKWSDLIHTTCTAITLTLVVFDAPKWLCVVTLVLSIALLADCVVRWVQGEEK